MKYGLVDKSIIQSNVSTTERQGEDGADCHVEGGAVHQAKYRTELSVGERMEQTAM